MLIFFTSLFVLNACNNSSTKNKVVQINSSSLKNDFYFLDSLHLQNALAKNTSNADLKKLVTDFYVKRDFEFVWINSTGINEFGKNLFNMLNNQLPILNSDTLSLSRISTGKFQKLFYSFLDKSQVKNDSLAVNLEILLTIKFYEYAQINWQGVSEVQSEKVDWFIKRKKIKYQLLLDSLLSLNPSKLSTFTPVYKQYSLLKEFLFRYQKIKGLYGSSNFDSSLIQLQLGDQSPNLKSIKKQLYLVKDLPSIDTSNTFNANLMLAIKQFQSRNGLKETGIISSELIDKLNTPIDELIIKILINMERCKWVPVELNSDYIVVNIPAFKMYVYQKGKFLWKCNAIVGRSNVTSNTIIFNDTLETIVFNPYWNIPKNILVKEILPQLKKNRNYLIKHNLEIVTNAGLHVSESSIDFNKYTTNFPYIIRQKPGLNNSLGLVKFLFPNNYNIYLHDTPQKYLFDQFNPAFSHGCIRIQEPIKLANFLLSDEINFSDKKVQALINQKHEKHIRLKNKVPIFIAYFTSWVDKNGKLNFRDDIYKHDQKMKMLLFEN